MLIPDAQSDSDRAPELGVEGDDFDLVVQESGDDSETTDSIGTAAGMM